MEILVEDIIYNENGIVILMQLPEELIVRELLFEIKRRNKDLSFSVFKKEIMPESPKLSLEIDSSNFEIPFYLGAEEVWDIRLNINNENQISLKNSYTDGKTFYIKNTWNNYNWKPYWTKENCLAFFIRYKKVPPQLLIKDVYISKSLYIKAEINPIESDNEYFIIINNLHIKEKYRINNHCYFEVSIEELKYDNSGTYSSNILFLASENSNQILLGSQDSSVQYNLETHLFKVNLSQNNDKFKLEINQKKKGISIIGSCVSRDNFNSSFNEDYKKDFKVIQLQNQPSIISLVSKPIPYNSSDLSNIGEWETKQLKAELEKSIFNQLKSEENDFLVLDFFADVYFGVLKIGESYLTNNNWVLHKTNFYRERSTYPTLNIFNQFDTFFVLWKKSIDELFKRISIVLPNTKVILHKARFTDSYITEDGEIALFENANKVSKYNRAWSLLDRYVESNFDVIPISISEDKLISTIHHKWGRFNVHYCLPYYHEFLKQLRKQLK